MSDRHISTETAEKWHRLSALWREANDRLEDIRLHLLTELEITAGKPLEAVEVALNAANGQAYMFAPQSEWTGGDSSDPKNFKFRPPHILS